MLVSVKQLKKETNQLPLIDSAEMVTTNLTEETRPENSKDLLLKKVTKGNILGEDENLEKRREMIAEKGIEPVDFAYERAIGANDSLYSNFIELLALTKRKVGKIIIKEDGKRKGCATGFMVSNCLILTNWHVFQNSNLAKESEVHFFYEYDVQGHYQSPVIFHFEPEKFFTAFKALDYCFVAVKPMDVTGKISLESIGYLYLDKGLGKLGEVNKEKLNIIHHPNGDYKQVSIRENKFVDINETMIFYETDTAQGSSGSPVFNDQWQVVGLHHKSVALMSADGNDYLDKDTEQPIPVTADGKIDVTRVKWLKNEGMRISVILKHLLEIYPGNIVVATLDMPPPKQVLRFSIDNGNENFTETNNNLSMHPSSNQIQINVPVSSLSNESSIDISLSSKKLSAPGVVGTPTQLIQHGTEKIDELLLEIKKEEREDAIDFSKCKGYDPKFLGINIPLPQPKKTILKQIARLDDDSLELKYFKYSVIFNAVTKMPLISAVNAEGDIALRKDNSKRNDNWLRDWRIDKDCQFTDGFYEKSGLDKGHMSRFEDANWDERGDEETAKRNGVYTCFYTNACPQVVKLNREGGVWGRIERRILEQGIKKEDRKQARMTVFNGPIFNEDKDKIYKGEIVPMDFYKIILWLDDNNKIKATAFKFSQELIPNKVKWDEAMPFDIEALDIDKDVDYKEYQCTIKSLSRVTKIDFSQIEKYDTYRKDAGGEETELVDEEAMML